MAPESKQSYAPDVEALTKVITEKVWNEYPGYSSDFFQQSDLIPSTRSNLDLALRVLQEEKPPTYEELAHARNVGATRARQLVPLESVIQAYRLTERVLMLDLFGRSSDSLDFHASTVAELLTATFDALTQQVINSYRETFTAVEGATRAAENQLVSTIASGLTVNDTEMEDWRRLLSVDVESSVVSIAITWPVGADQLETQRALRRLKTRLELSNRVRVLIGSVADATLVLVVASERGDLQDHSIRLAIDDARLPDGCAVGVGQPAENLRSASVGCQQSMDAAKVAGVRQLGRIVIYHEALIELLLQARPQLSSILAASRLNGLSAHPHLRETLVSLINNDLSQARVARELYVHINTVANRLRKINELTGFDPLHLRDLVEMAVALRWEDLQG
ncbi:PucR family transcriptional regulator [Aeromicrobium ginsengisoli]|uniref:PucR family transcriptional regulator n=1 Tax=Aeromicrobium ginsengisoli TaxID=363867 RepID=A0A5M4FEX6_9ACTN|nr:helix-turn-helix domain-containing protein [Aeromicrobium ginsengisoli]KAA1397760.1 PucR family transcriptional regulator [Aeromicrobium ginsengisoli]